MAEFKLPTDDSWYVCVQSTSHMCASLYALADHGLCEFIFWKHLFVVLVNKTINDDHEDCDTRRDTISIGG